LRDYLYIPLGGNQHGRLTTLRNLMITMFLGGLWHGAGAFFIVWGLYHGLLLVLYRILPIDTALIDRFGRVGRALSVFLFFHFVCLGWIFFRATPAEFLPIIKSIANLPFAAIKSFVGEPELLPAIIPSKAHLMPGPVREFIIQNPVFSTYAWGLFLFTIPLACFDYLGWRFGCEFPDLFQRMSWMLRAVLIAVLFYGILFFARREANEFIYFAF
jgi:hypothetical protein